MTALLLLLASALIGAAVGAICTHYYWKKRQARWAKNLLLQLQPDPFEIGKAMMEAFESGRYRFDEGEEWKNDD